VKELIRLAIKAESEAVRVAAIKEMFDQGLADLWHQRAASRSVQGQRGQHAGCGDCPPRAAGSQRPAAALMSHGRRMRIISYWLDNHGGAGPRRRGWLSLLRSWLRSASRSTLRPSTWAARRAPLWARSSLPMHQWGGWAGGGYQPGCTIDGAGHWPSRQTTDSSTSSVSSPSE